MNYNFAIGQKLTLTCFNTPLTHHITGFFHSFNTDKTRITLTDVVYYPSGERHPKQSHFFSSEVKSITAEKPMNGMKAFIDPEVGRSLAFCKGPSHPHLSYMYNQPERGLPHPDRKLRPDYEKFSHKYETFQVIKEKDEQFEQAMKTLEGCQEVGVAFEGKLMGRFGQLCWVNFSDGHTSYLFDVLALGLDDAIVSILKSEKVLKIVHDSRLVSDCLMHKHELKLVNTVDTQVFDLMIMRAKRENCPSYASALNECLKSYLGISEMVLLTPFVWEEKIKDETAKWAKRPLADLELELAVQNVAFLKDLYAKMQAVYFEPVKVGSEFYLNHVSSMTDKEAEKYNAMGHLTPRQLYWVCRNKNNEIIKRRE
ncbi:Hypothetical predicted protein [Cloeon dipterum]|uniref:3'-5' exonuclease domain-containing protein n=1 Tax=Cloeon dipterum TaxID=197152 RepID=A0A8S1D4X7_9INSE|nr:Hypothetical predicted protein [Cloeon dipterum]